MRLGDTRHEAGFTDYLIGNPWGPSYKAASKGVMADQEEYSREKRRWRRVIFGGNGLMKRTHYPKDASSLGIGMDLVREEVKGTSKVVIVIAKSWRLKDHPRWMFRKNSMEFFVELLNYLYKFYRGYATTNPRSCVLLEYSTITWPCHMIWLPKFPCYL